MKQFEVVFTKYFSYYVEAEDYDNAIDVAEEIFRAEMRSPIADTTYDEVDTYEGEIEMRIVKCEKIFLSMEEQGVWSNFDQILEGLERGCENSETIRLVNKIQSLLSDLWEEVEDIE